MAIRLRKVDGTWVALCAVESDPKEGDLYLDDGQHYALATKFAEDWKGETQTGGDPRLAALMESQKVRDAREVYREIDEQQQFVDLHRGYCVLVDEESAGAEVVKYRAHDVDLDRPGTPVLNKIQQGQCLACGKGGRNRWFLCAPCFTTLPVRVRRIMYGSDGCVGSAEVVTLVRGILSGRRLRLC